MQNYWLRISVIVPNEFTSRIEEALDILNAIAITTSDANNTPIFDSSSTLSTEWDAVEISAIFDPNTNLDKIKSIIKQLAEPSTTIIIDKIQDKNWELHGYEEFKPILIGKNLCICPPWQNKPSSDHLIRITINPGLAFGTGKHATTQLCLEQLQNTELANKIVLDWGCGSGILALACISLGAKSVFAVDNDFKAIESSIQNAELNNAGNALTICSPSDMDYNLTADIIVANILANTIIDLSDTFNHYLKQDGLIILSGVMENQADKVKNAFSGFYFSSSTLDDWVVLIGKRSSAG